LGVSAEPKLRHDNAWSLRFAQTPKESGNAAFPETLLGVIPLEDMDLMVNPVERCLVGAHGDKWVQQVR
jgi:hypothetical protein